jgi:hypothetical protein
VILAENIINMVKAHHSLVFRRVLIKRRALSTGAYESSWFDITNDVKKFGTIKYEADSKFAGRFRFPTLNLTVVNDEGQFGPEDSIFSYWSGYLPRARTLVRIEAGFVEDYDYGDGTFARIEHPSEANYDEAYYEAALYDDDSGSAVFTGFIGGDITENDQNEVTIPVKPLTEAFREYAARNITGYNTSLTASDFITLVRDQVDGSGSKVFLPFFGNTTTGFSIASTAVEYSNLSTSTSADVIDANVWEIIEKLAGSENYLPIVTAAGRFRFVPRDSNTTTAAFVFNGLGVYDFEYGNTIKKINFLGPKISKLYTRVEVKYREEDTTTSYEVVESTLTVSPPSISWQYGQRTFRIDNTWIPNSTIAQSIATSIFTDYSALKREIDFNTTFVPGLDLLDQVQISYDISRFISPYNLWDIGNWADSISAVDDLVFDPRDGDAIYLNSEEFNLISIELNIDNFECRFVARET